MTPPAEAIQTDGRGADVVFLHGTGADKSSWRVLTALLRQRIRATAYDRRGSVSWPIADHDRAPLVHDHAEDAADVILGLGTQPVDVCAASFGAVIALELMKRRPELVRSAVLFEPALSGDDRICSVPRELTDEIEKLFGNGEPERAAEHFYRRAVGDAAWSILPTIVRTEMTRRGTQIRHELLANAAYRVDYQELGKVVVPVLLLQGGRSRKAFEPPLRALHAALPRSQRQLIECAEHVPFGGAWHEYAAALTGFIARPTHGLR